MAYLFNDNANKPLCLPIPDYSKVVNVAATVFLASELEDLDVHDQVNAILSATLGSAARPGGHKPSVGDKTPEV
jgi:hypothetical protein